MGAFVGGIFTPFGIPISGLNVERNGSKNYIEPGDGQCKKPDPHPHREPEYNPVVTPPRAPDGGVGTQPYFTRNTKCTAPGDGSKDTIPTFNAVSPLGSMLSSPASPEPVSPLKAPAAVNPLTAIFSGGK